MEKTIEPKLKRIGEYLELSGESIFVVPEYQRAYSWTISQCDKLWQDIDNYIKNGDKSRYFFGTVIINCDEDDKLSLIDGQQRTTTFLLLLKALLFKINEAIPKCSSDSESLGLLNGLKQRRRSIMRILYKADVEEISDEPNSSSDRSIYERCLILENKSINESSDYINELKTILEAIDYNYAENKVFKLPRKQKDNKYTNYFRNFKFFYEEKVSRLNPSELNQIAKTIIDSCEIIEIKSWQVEQAIEMFNSLNSDGLPLSDADIISAKMFASAKKNNKSNEYKELWNKLNEAIKYLENKKIVNINSILMQLMYYERTKNGDTKPKIDGGQADVTTPGLRRYFTEINKNLINNPIYYCEKLLNLVKIWDKVSQFPVAQVLFKFNENSKLFLASYFYRFDVKDITEENTKVLFECMLRLFSLLDLTDIGYSSSMFKTFLFTEEIKLVNESITINEIKRDFDNHINKQWNEEIIYSSICEYERNAMVYLKEMLYAKEKSINFIIEEKCEIEHIMPQSGKNKSEIIKDAGIENFDEFQLYVNKLGNKILLEEDINKSIGNEWFRTKISNRIKDKKGYKDSKYPMANALVNEFENQEKPYWTKEDIDKYTAAVAKLISSFIFGK